MVAVGQSACSRISSRNALASIRASPPAAARIPNIQLPAINILHIPPPQDGPLCQSHSTATMTSLKSICLLAGRRPALLLHHNYPFPASAIPFSTSSVQRHATPRPPPPTGFRIGRQETWEDGGSSLDKAAKYFLMSEMARGMYVVLEQFFRAPYTIMYPFEKVRITGGRRGVICMWFTYSYSFRFYRARFRRASEESMH